MGSAILLGISPFLATIGVLIKWKGGRGPILFTQERVSVDGRRFRMYKFRSMVEDAEKETGPVFATSDDPRRTAIGALLRSTTWTSCPSS